MMKSVSVSGEEESVVDDGPDLGCDLTGAPDQLLRWIIDYRRSLKACPDISDFVEIHLFTAVLLPDGVEAFRQKRAGGKKLDLAGVRG